MLKNSAVFELQVPGEWRRAGLWAELWVLGGLFSTFWIPLICTHIESVNFISNINFTDI
jgi:hypothetical protein